jgi:hypothetical protein
LPGRGQGGGPGAVGPLYVEEVEQELLLASLPGVGPFALRDATHRPDVENPRGTADALTTLFGRYPNSVST